MEEQTGRKRSLFTPIVLFLLVMSLIANVFLYSQRLQNAQLERKQEGTLIIQAGWDAKAFFTSVMESVDNLLNSGDATAGIAAKQTLGFAFRHEDSVPLFIHAADGKEGKEALSFRNRDAREFITQIESSLTAVANDSGPLSETERSYLTQVGRLFHELSAIANRFDLDRESVTTAIRTEAGGEWVDIAYELSAVMDRDARITLEHPKQQ